MHYTGTSAQQIAPARYGHLLLSDGAETGKHLAGRTHFGNMGLTIEAGPDNLDTVTVKRTTGAAIIKNGQAGISRIWEICRYGAAKIIWEMIGKE